MPVPAQKLLEFDRLKQIVAAMATCASGHRAVAALEPGRDVPALNAQFALIREAIAFLRPGGELGLACFADPELWLARLSVPGAVLEPAELLAVLSLIDTSEGVKQTLREEHHGYPLLSALAASLGDFRPSGAAIRRAVMPNGEIADGASSALRNIRAGILEARDKVQRSLQSILRAHPDGGESYVTLRNDRFVIPVRASVKSSIPGVVHGASATGQTVFLEPLQSIELNNRMVQLREEEAAEIARILAELSDRLRSLSEPLAATALALAQLDSVFARARYARQYDCTLPIFSPNHSLWLSRARNPVLEATLRPQGRQTVPSQIALGASASGTVMVISGPNTGGKTVALKTTGLAALSAQSGIPVAAERAELPVFDRVLADIGDEQSIAADLSTFSAHMLNLKAMLDVASDESLILVDEMGTGTAPEEGAALSVALLEEFRRRGALTIATTHHDRLKAYASTTPGIVNAAMEFDTTNLRPTYRLLMGVPGTSSGIEIARRLGLPPQVIEHARQSLSPATREAAELIAYLHRSRDELDDLKRQAREEIARCQQERRSLQTEWVARQKERIGALEKSFQATEKRLEQEVAQLAEALKTRAQGLGEKQTMRRVGKLASAARAAADAAVLETLAAAQADLGVSHEPAGAALEPAQLSAGQRVRVRGFKQAVIFRRLDGGSAEIEAGPMRMKVPLAEILSLEGPATAALRPTAPEGGVTVSARPLEAVDEINVIGCTVEEASEKVDKFLDQATLAAKPSVRIIHGYGTGALRRGLAEFLRGHPLVESIHAEAKERGGEAVTVAELKG